MSVSREALLVFNRGIVDRRALARLDVTRVSLSAEEQTNIIPRVLGSMSLRPGTEFHDTFENDNEGRYVPFEFAFDDNAILEMTASTMRIWNSGDTLVTRSVVTATIANGTFDSDLTSWTDADEAGAASTWLTGGYMQLLGGKYTEARRQQAVTITETTTDHALRVIVQRGPLYIRVGTTAGADDVFKQAVLRTGTHSLAFTPGAATIYIELASPLDYPVLVDSIAVESNGHVTLPTPWTTVALIDKMRWTQVGDVVFVACDGVQQRRIERRTGDSWSVVLYETNDGPFIGPNADRVRITPSALAGLITLTASRNLFATTSVGQIFKLTSQGQSVESDITVEGTFSDSIQITGVSESRDISVVRAGTWVATVSLQRSIGAPGSWVTVATYSTNATVNYNDGLDNSTVFYRIGVETGNFTSGTAELDLIAEVGTITGVVRVTAYTSATVVSAVVLTALGGTGATEIWEEGSWSDLLGYPTAVQFYEGSRLWWFGRGRSWGSISDDLTGYDPAFEGDSAPINRGIGTGSVDVINWALPLQRLVAGSGAAEHSIRSTSFDEPITPSNYNVKEASTQGSRPVPAVRVGGRGYFVQRSGGRIYELNYDIQKSDYDVLDLTALTPDIGESPFVRLAVQMQPDQRVWGLRADGTAAVIIRDPAEDVLGVFEIEAGNPSVGSATIEDIVILPGEVEDRVFWVVKRTILGSTVRSHEEVQLESNCRGGTVNRQADAAVHYSGVSTTTFGGLTHLRGETVVAWANGKDLGTFLVSVSGQITLSEAFTEAWAGLTYRGRYKSSKLAIQTALGLHLSERGRIIRVGLILADAHYQGLKFGPDFVTMDELPLIENAVATAADTVWTSHDEDMVEFPGDWETDSRLCLEMNAPKPCTVMAATVLFETDDASSKSSRRSRG